MAAKKFDFKKDGDCSTPCEVGADFSFSIIRQLETAPGSGIFNPVDLTGWSAKMQVRQDVGQAVVIELSTANSRIALNSPLGNIQLHILAADTAMLTPGLYKYDLELTDETGFVYRLIEGFFQIVGAITV